ncbi:MAG: hypothetical protein HN572_08420, partial [Kordiimonadaceae bacterium]|nr:hypothetical protein [Kordiimonadaceae bacterium]
VGMIPAADVFDPQIRIYELMQKGDPGSIAEAERLHKELLPLLVFMMSSVENFVAYGKDLMAQRLGLENGNARQPSVPVTDFGRSVVSHWARELGPFPSV